MIAIPNSWPAEIKVDTISPLIYLKAQANYIREMTMGALVGRVTSEKIGDDEVVHRLDLIAQPLKSASAEILSVSHSLVSPYPAIVLAEKFDENEEFADDAGRYPGDGYTNSHEELQTHVAKVLSSRRVVSTIYSFIARINEQKILQEQA